ncbi:APC family permease [Flammeovirga pectinis]|uniref:APC family permease n=1 Tax=Flammeovirga pectinis TaxID=2494373 RepID=A0A3S9NZW8_9BACT|nr:APC family permease [Flammeovirga pectinis]AZQ61460.1 APC family permease [Flammeovirga pectinis]
MEDKSKISLKDAISIGIGGMVGGGIFAVLGLSVTLAKGGVPISFFVAGMIALMTAYSYAKLSVAYPDEGGTVRFINEGFGYSVFSGGLNNMLWVSYIIMLSLYSSAFGAYASSLFQITGNVVIDQHIFLSGIIIISTFINYYSIKVVGEVEAFAVIIKLVILLAFVAAGFWGITDNPNFQQLNPENWESPLQLIAGGMVIFVAYEGFELIANSAPDIDKPKINIPRAYYGSVIFVICLYIAIAIVTVGSLDFTSIGKAAEYVLAEAAKPKFGQVGFTIISIAAMISTFSAINATLLGGSRVNHEVAVYNELPTEFTRSLWGKPFGLFIIAILSLVIANSIDLESISTSGSAGFLIIFGIVNYIAFKKAKDVGANKVITLIGFICCFAAFFILTIQQSKNNLEGILTAFLIFTLCFVGEWLFQNHLKNKIDKSVKK